jgi:hypothetical protein
MCKEMPVIPVNGALEPKPNNQRRENGGWAQGFGDRKNKLVKLAKVIKPIGQI